MGVLRGVGVAGSWCVLRGNKCVCSSAIKCDQGPGNKKRGLWCWHQSGPGPAAATRSSGLASQGRPPLGGWVLHGRQRSPPPGHCPSTHWHRANKSGEGRCTSAAAAASFFHRKPPFRKTPTKQNQKCFFFFFFFVRLLKM